MILFCTVLPQTPYTLILPEGRPAGCPIAIGVVSQWVSQSICAMYLRICAICSPKFADNVAECTNARTQDAEIRNWND